MEKEELLSSGLLELYVLGQTDPQETKIIEEMFCADLDIRNEILAIERALENYATAHAKKPDPTVKPFLLATLDYIKRRNAGEIFIPPPLLNDKSLIQDYLPWTERADMQLPDDFEEVHAKILNHNAAGMTVIAWIKTMAPQEIHHNEYEKFLILEGTCTIYIEDEAHMLGPGAFLTVPLHKKHHVVVTSSIPCKVILQRIAA